jgi:O-antigen/teichoic acid export membrane protein
MSMPFGLALPLLIGELQGQQRFGAYVFLTTGQAALKLISAFVFGIALGPIGVVLGLVAATAISYGVALGLLRRKLAIRANMPWLRPALRYLIVVLPSTVALSVLLSADVLLVKHFFSTKAAGEYAAVAALGRAVFWGAAGVAAVLFPKVTFSETQGRSGSRIVGASLGLVAGGGIAGLASLALFAKPVLSTFAGSAYAEGASILPLYTIAMTLLGGASVLIATHQSRARAAFLSVLIPITVAEPALIIAFHHDPMQVVWVLTVSMASLMAGLGIQLVRKPQRRASDEPLPLVAMAEVKA